MLSLESFLIKKNISRSYFWSALYKSMAERGFLLPGGSKMEGFEVDPHSARRQRRAVVLAICAVAGLACLATAGVSRSRASELLAVEKQNKPQAQLRQQPVDKADAYLQKHGVPSWLSTKSVSLKPLSVMIQEQLTVKKMKSKAADQKHAKQAAQAANAPTPHELAMKNAMHALAVTKVSATSRTVAAAAPTTQALKEVDSPVKHAVTTDTPSLGNGGDAAKPAVAAVYHKGELKAKEADLKQLKKEEREEELVIENSEREKLTAIRDEEIRVNKEEVHKLAKIKTAGAKHEKAIVAEIEKLQKEKAAEQVNEKRAIKAEMAKIEDEAHEKLQNLMAKMQVIKSGGVLKVAPKAKEETKAETAKAVSSEGATHSVAKARGHTVVQKPEVKVHAAAAAGGKTTAAAVTSTLKVAPTARRSGCTTTKCDLTEEDKQWGKIGDKVDDYAREAAHAHGKAKAAALAHMQYLQEQIENDSKHVTGFAVAQEHALPPAPKIGA